MTMTEALRPGSQPPAIDEPPWTLDGRDVALRLGSDPTAGLSSNEATRRLASVGPNDLVAQKEVPRWRILVRQFTDTMIVVLVVAAIVTAFIGDLRDTAVILAIVSINGLIGFVQEYRAERAMAALKAMTSPTARVVRDGRIGVITAGEVVPGDIVSLEAGDVISADARLLETPALRVNEAVLTGESEPASKVITALAAGSDAILADQRNMVFKGTSVTYGRATAVVVATGMDTALGAIAGLMQRHAAGQTPLQARLAALGRALAAAALVVCGVVFVTGVVRGEDLQLMFLTSVSLAVAAIPEALPAVVTVSLALGAQRMARHRALIRKLPAVETLGSVTVVCSDKTGTLTQNRMLVERVWTPEGEYRVSGDGYEPAGEIVGDVDPATDRHLWALGRVAAACNDAALHAPPQAGRPWSISGDPTEGALMALAGKLRRLEAAPPEGRRVAELAFDSARRRMCTLHEEGDGIWVAVKGALEALSPLGVSDQAEVWAEAARVAERYAAEGYRVLALAERRLVALPIELDHAEQGITLLGLVGMADPPREGSAAAVASARAAGVIPVLVTGDHALTAAAIAKRLGILVEGRRVVTGAELARLDDADLDAVVADVAVYARTDPEQKLRIVDAWKRRGAVVAMTGDGVNDAPALRRADIGVAMGIAGTQVSQEAADMVLADDEFRTIVTAIEEGRRVYDNIRRFVRYALTTNSGEIWVMALAPFAGLPIPLLPIHILWINLVTDGLPGVALGVEPVERNAMRRPPRPSSESILGRGLWQHALRVGLLMGAVTLSVQAGAIALGWHWQTMVFSTLVMLQLGNALAVRSERESIFSLGWHANRPLMLAIIATLAVQLAIVYLPPLQTLFATQAMAPAELVVMLAASTTAFLASEVEKWVARRRERGRSPVVARQGEPRGRATAGEAMTGR
jgi:Ca2+-transporting ATPase